MRRTGPSTGKPKMAGTYLLALLAMLFWGLSFVWSTIVFKYYSPVTTVFLRLILSSLFIWGYILVLRKGQKIQHRHLRLFLLSALFMPFLYFIGENYGLKLSTPTVSAVVIATIPVFTPIAAYFVIRERLTIVNILGILLSFTGILVLLVKPDMSLSANYQGLGFLMLAVAAAVVYSIMVKRLLDHYAPLTIIAVQNLIGIFYFFPLVLLFDLQSLLEVRPNWELVSSLLQLSIFASSLAFIFFVKVIGKIGVSRANVFSYLIPVFTAVFSFILVGEMITWTKIAGMVIVLGGVIISQWRPAKPINIEQKE